MAKSRDWGFDLKLRAFLLACAAGAGAQEPERTLRVYESDGAGGLRHTLTYLVSPAEAVKAYAASPWSRQGTTFLGPNLPGTAPLFADGFLPFLAAHFLRSSEDLPSPCILEGVIMQGMCLFTCVGFPIPQYCSVSATPVGGFCNGSCSQGCRRTGPPGYCSYTAPCGPCSSICPQGGQFFQVPGFCFGGGCDCPPPPPPPCPCASVGPGQPSGSTPLSCVTEPRLGVTFTVSIQTPTAPSVSALLVGGCLPFQRTMIDPSLCTNLYQWTEPAFVLSRVDAREFSMGIPNDARFLGALVCVQAVFTDTTLCWRATDGMRFLICQ